MHAADVAQANREPVADESAASAGEDGRTAGETCSLLPAFSGGKPSAEAALWEYGAADRGAVASGGIAEAVAGKSIESQEATEACLTRPDGKAWSIVAGLALGHSGTFAAPSARPKGIIMRQNPEGVYSVWLLGLERKFQLTSSRKKGAA